MARLGNASDRLVSSSLQDVGFSNGRERKDVVFSFIIYEVYMVMEASRDLLVH